MTIKEICCQITFCRRPQRQNSEYIRLMAGELCRFRKEHEKITEIVYEMRIKGKSFIRYYGKMKE